MPPEIAAAPGQAARRSISAVDLRPAAFERRADPASLPERMDGPCDFETLRGCLRSLEQINRLTGSYRPTLRFLARASAGRAAGSDSTRPLRILDVGCGYGDTLRRIYRWAQERGAGVELTGIDLNPHAVRAATEASAAAGLPAGAIHWAVGDALAETTSAPPDLVICSLLTHHLADAEIVRLLGWMEATAKLGWFINDLERRPRPARLFGLLTAVLRSHPFVRHDGPVSFRRAFRAEDWRGYLAEAGVAEAEILPTFPARLCVARLQ